MFAQDICEPVYTVPRLMLVNSVSASVTTDGPDMENTGQNATGEPRTIQMFAGQALQETDGISDNGFYSSSDTYNASWGFYSYYLKEPVPPTMFSSDGDYDNKIVVDWIINDGTTGPPVTSTTTKLMRNGLMLTELSIDVTQYQDFNVFAGVTYEYEAIVSNSKGDSHDGSDYGFLNPNGVVTGQISTPSGNPVENATVLLTPNLGRSAKFNGDGYIYWFDADSSRLQQFRGLEASYTIETWFRSVTLNDDYMTLFAAADSATTNHFIDILIDDEGYVVWRHTPRTSDDPLTYGQATEIQSVNKYAGAGETFHHLALVYNDATKYMNMFVDGYIVASGTASGAINDSCEIVMGKKGPSENDNYFRGYLDDFRIWNTARDWEDIRAYRNITLSGFEDSLKAYWKFDEEAGDKVFDLAVDKYITSEDIFDFNGNFVETINYPDGKPFDNDGEVCLVDRSDVIGDVFVGGITDEVGNYYIKQVAYGGGTSFTATPSQSTIVGRSVEFDGSADYIDFFGKRLSLSDSSGVTVEGWFKTPGSSNEMTILSVVEPITKNSELKVFIAAGGENISVDFLGTTISTSGAVNDNMWHHWAVALNNSAGTLSIYIDGSLSDGSGSAVDVSSLTAGLADLSEFRFAADVLSSGASNYFLGFLDEIRFWEAPRTVDQITGTMNQVLDGTESGLQSYWNFNDATGFLINDIGPGLSPGMMADTSSAAVEGAWSIDIPLEEAFTHYYTPESRLVTLNHSNISVDLVNFTDLSLIPITGYVNYAETPCFIEGAQILVDGQSLIPPVYTSESGKFTIELEPGSIGSIVSVDYSEHDSDDLFDPTYIELPMLTKPLSGQYFSSDKTSNIAGIVAGGDCEFSLATDAGDIEVTLSAVNGCYEETVVVDESTNQYYFDDVPPLIYNISVYHPDPEIVFDADTISVESRDRDDKDFIYYAPLEFGFVGNVQQFEEQNEAVSTDDGINIGHLDQLKSLDASFVNADDIVAYPFTYAVYFNAFESYNGGNCVVEDYTLHVVDEVTPNNGSYGISSDSYDNTNSGPYPGNMYYSFTAAEGNSLSGGDNPHQLPIQLTAETDDGRSASGTIYLLVIDAIETFENSGFTLSESKRPTMVIRVPPGDGSSTTIESGSIECRENSFRYLNESGLENEAMYQNGSETTVCVGPPGIETCNKYDFDLDYTFNTKLTVSTEVARTQTRCLEFTETYTAYGDGVVTGKNATVFIGSAESHNFNIGLGVYLNRNDDGVVEQYTNTDGELVSPVYVDTTFTLGETSVASTYMHSRFYIENVLMPDIELFMAQEEENSESFNAYQQDYFFWEELLAREDELIASASNMSEVFRNFGSSQDGDGNSLDEGTTEAITFDAGVDYTYTTTSSKQTVKSTTVDTEVSVDASFNFGMVINGYGMFFRQHLASSSSYLEGESGDTTVSFTNSFTLGDDEPGDGFSFQVFSDDDYNMAVFDLIGGQSSCPWEPGTLQRQAASITSGTPILLNNPPEEAAIFTVVIGNLSETDDDESYLLALDATTNPNGLEVYAAGSNLVEGVTVTVPAGEQLEMDIAVYRGPEEYVYDPIDIEIMPPCEVDIADAKGADAAIQGMDNIELTVSYKEPCSESTVSFPEDGWIVDASHSDGDTLKVTVSGYDLENEYVDELKLQYRKNSLGDWFNAEIIDVDTLRALDEDFVIIDWNISPSIVTDGFYELRSVITCSGDAYDGVSQINSGLIDREGPEQLLTTPASGVLGTDNLISLTMNETIDCDAIILGSDDAHIKLTNTNTGDDIDFTYTCGDDIILITPAIADRFLENQTLRADVSVLYDVYGNGMDEEISWEFYFNKNPVGWVGTDISNIIIYEDEEYSTTRILENVGGSSNSYYIFDGRDISIDAAIYPDNVNALPAWIDVSPTEGTLTADSQQEITIGLTEGLDFGEYTTTIYAGVNGVGDEDLDVYIRKLCYEPSGWVVDPSDFEFSMNMTAVLYTQPTAVVTDTSADIYDMVGVFVGDELRGVANVEYLPALESLSNFHPYEVFLTIYSNTTQQENLSFKVWDASECTMLGTVLESYSFEINEVLGSLTNPVPLTATAQIVTEIPYTEGWTWASFNTSDTISSDMLVNTILGNMNSVDGDIIKSQDGFSIYDPTVGWFPASFEIDHQQMYKIKLQNLDTLTRVGYAIDVELDTIDVNVGWNWIGFTPQESYEVNEALESLGDVLTGDLIKSQSAFAQYLENYGWFGSLIFMSPKNGYLLKSSNEGELLYPFTIARSSEPIDEESIIASTTPVVSENVPEWVVDYNQYSSSMSIVASLVSFDSTSRNSNDIVGAFVNGECRGTASPQYVEPLDAYLLFLTVHGDESESGDVIFQVYHEETDEILYVPVQERYNANDVVGTLTEPYVIDARTLAIGDPGYVPVVFSLAQNYPNPFNPVTKIGYGIAEDAVVTISVYNLIGERVATLVNENKNPGYYFTNWDSKNDMGMPVSAGMYIYQIRAGEYVKSRKLILLK